MAAGFDQSGNVTAWKHEAFMAPNNDSTMLGPILVGVQAPSARTPVGSWTGPDLYQFPNLLELAHQLPELGAATSPYPFGIRTTFLRSPGQYQITFAQEAFVDEIAAKTEQDPLQFRLQSSPTRGRSPSCRRRRRQAVGVRTSPGKTGATTAGGRHWAGISFVLRDGTYAAGVVKLEVTPATGKVLLTEVTVAQDQGQIINPRAIEPQISSCVIQTASRVLHEEVKFDTSNVTTVDWDELSDAPDGRDADDQHGPCSQPADRSLGVGEPAVNVMPSAISSAIFDATGVRLRTMPFTAEVVKAAMEQLISGRARTAFAACRSHRPSRQVRRTSRHLPGSAAPRIVVRSGSAPVPPAAAGPERGAAAGCACGARPGRLSPPSPRSRPPGPGRPASAGRRSTARPGRSRRAPPGRRRPGPAPACRCTGRRRRPS